MSKVITDEQVARLRELEAKATRGPWEPTQYCADSSYFDINASGELVIDSDGTNERNADLIAESRNALPLMLDSIVRLKEALAISRSLLAFVNPDVDSLDADLKRIREILGE